VVQAEAGQSMLFRLRRMHTCSQRSAPSSPSLVSCRATAGSLLRLLGRDSHIMAVQQAMPKPKAGTAGPSAASALQVVVMASSACCRPSELHRGRTLKKLR